LRTLVKKINFLIVEDILREMELIVPQGKRSKLVNQALRKELELLRRRQAVEKLLAASPPKRHFSNREIIEGLSKDRGNH
jgi:hypothetical protein